ncbi:MAG TPA: hypothetical protein VGC56_10175 [Allosphingosinicella sp.]
MRGHTIWQRLGIEPTDDVGVIRRAYADKLRATDADGDAQAFAALRAARDAALAHAAYAAASGGGEADETPAEPVAHKGGAGEEWTPDSDWDDFDMLDASAPLPLPEPLPDSAVDEEAAERAGRFQEVERLLFSEEGDAADAPDRLFQLTEEILADPILEQIDAAAGIERWLAGTAAAAIPRSDPMLVPLAAAFHWEERWTEYDQPAEIVAIVQRLGALRFIDQVQSPSHPYHKAWRDLESGKPKLGLERFTLSSTVRALLGHIRTQAPTAEQSLDPYRVALWEERHNRGWPIAGGISLLWIAFLALRILTPVFGTHDPAPVTMPYPAAYSDPAADLRPAIQAVVPGMTFEEVERDNPNLADRLRADWSDARARGDDSDGLRERERDFLLSRMRAGLSTGTMELQTRYWALEADKLRWLRTRSPVACGDYEAGGSHPKFPEDLYARDTHLRADAMLSATTEAPPGPSTIRYMLSAPVVTAARSRSGLSLAAFRAAIVGKGGAEERCAARIAVLDAVLAAPRANAKTIKAMSKGL